MKIKPVWILWIEISRRLKIMEISLNGVVIVVREGIAM